MITQRGAKKLLRVAFPIRSQVDSLMWHCARYCDNVRVIIPRENMFWKTTRNIFQSTIQTLDLKAIIPRNNIKIVATVVMLCVIAYVLGRISQRNRCSLAFQSEQG